MIIHIQDVILEFANDSKQTENIINAIDENLRNKNLHFSYLIIDEIPVYDDFFNYLNSNSVNIKKVEVIVKTLKEIVIETIVSTDDYVKNAIPLITALADAFYQQPDGDSWLKLNDLFVGIQWIIETISKIDAIKGLDEITGSYEVWNEYVQEASQLRSIISELETAVVGKDAVTIADILMYEIRPVFEKFDSKLPFLLEGEGVNSAS